MKHFGKRVPKTESVVVDHSDPLKVREEEMRRILNINQPVDKSGKETVSIYPK